VDVVPVFTVPKSYGDGKTLRTGAATVFVPEEAKSANTVCEPFIVIVQTALPEQAPDQPTKAEVPSGIAVRVTDVPLLKFAAHWLGQEIPTGLLTTVPVPPKLFAVTNNG